MGVMTCRLPHARKSVTSAGGRLIDTAYMYHNEDAVGEGVRTCGVPREELFVTTKLYPSQFTNPESAIEDELLADPELTIIAQAHSVSIPQVILRWNRQRGIVVIPGSSNPAHIEEDLDIHGFSLTEEEMACIAALDRAEKHDWY